MIAPQPPVPEASLPEAASPDSPVPNPAAPPPRVPAVHEEAAVCIELRRLHRYFGDTKAVRDISFSVRRGQVFGYIGPNGAGKTTSMKILATLDLPSYGEAFVDGFSVINDPELVRHRLGYMPDSFGTYRDVSCWEYLDFFARAYGLIGRDRIRRLRWVLDFTGTRGMAEKPIRGLSKGMKQRLCLGRALIHDPSVLILDEPAAGLDPRARIELRRMIGELSDRGKTLLVSSHILTELAEMCHSVAIIEQGRLLATGSVEEIQRERKQHRELVFRSLSDPAKLAQALAQNPTCHNVQAQDDSVIVEFVGQPADQAELVRGLILAGHPITEVSSRLKSLEEIFLQVTEGRVQ